MINSINPINLRNSIDSEHKKQRKLIRDIISSLYDLLQILIHGIVSLKLAN